MTNGKRCDRIAELISEYRVREPGTKKKSEKNFKKYLTNEKRYDRIAKLNSIVQDLIKSQRRKKSKKISKKCLTNRNECAKIANVPPMRRVPCKLNNVTKRKHQTELEL